MGELVTLRQLFEKQFAPIKLRGRQPDTFRLYRLTIKMFGDYLGRDATIEDLNDLTVAEFLLWYEDRPSVKSAKTVNNRRQNLQTLWEFAARKGLTPTFPDIQRLPEPEIVPKARTIEELQGLLSHIDTDPSIRQVGRIPGWLYWRTLHLWWFYTGERSGATLMLEWEMLDLETGVAQVPARIRKGKVKAKRYELPPHVAEQLKMMRALDSVSKLVFGAFKFNKSTWYNRYSAILKKAGLPADRLSKGHMMRRTHGTHLEIAGGDAQESLGHSRPETTKRYIDPEQKRSGRPPAWQLLPHVS